MELPAQIAEAALQLLRIQPQPAWHPHEGEVVAVPAEPENPAAMRAEVLVHRRSGATGAALGDGRTVRLLDAKKNGFRAHEGRTVRQDGMPCLQRICERRFRNTTRRTSCRSRTTA